MQYIITPKGQKYLDKIERLLQRRFTTEGVKGFNKSMGTKAAVLTGIEGGYIENMITMNPQEIKDDIRRALGGLLEAGYIDIITTEDELR